MLNRLLWLYMVGGTALFCGTMLAYIVAVLVLS